MIKKWIVIVILLVAGTMILSSCGGRKRVCDYAAEVEYGKENVIKVSGWSYLVRTEDKILVIAKTNVCNPETTNVIDVTEFVKGVPK